MSEVSYINLEGHNVPCEPPKEGFEATQNLWYAKKAIQNIIRNKHLCTELRTVWSSADDKDFLIRICQEVASHYQTAKFHQGYLVKELRSDLEGKFLQGLLHG